MEHLNKRKPNLLFFWFLLPFVLYGGYAVGRLEGDQISIENIREMLLYSLTHPWPMRFTLLTVKALLILLLIWGFAVIWYVGNYRSLIPGLEYGSARFADLKQVNEKLKDADDSKNKILSENIRMSINTRKTGLNNNVTVIGGSGAGKSFHYVMPNAMKGDTSMVLTDPKAEFTVNSISAQYVNGTKVSSSVRYKAIDENVAKVTLPEGVVLVNETTGARSSGAVSIAGGDDKHAGAEDVKYKVGAVPDIVWGLGIYTDEEQGTRRYRVGLAILKLLLTIPVYPLQIIDTWV